MSTPTEREALVEEYGESYLKNGDGYEYDADDYENNKPAYCSKCKNEVPYGSRRCTFCGSFIT